MSAVFEALAAPRRREILRLVWKGERSSGQIHEALDGLTFGAVSQHLAVLESAGLVSRREEGRFHFYVARRKELGLLGQWLDQMWEEALDGLRRHAEAEEQRRKHRPRARRPTGQRSRRS